MGARFEDGAKSSVFNMSVWAVESGGVEAGSVGSVGFTGQVEPKQAGDWLIRSECND